MAERAGVNVGEAFEILRRAARASRRPISDLADDVANGRVGTDTFAT